jgi:hypothetical protein
MDWCGEFREKQTATKASEDPFRGEGVGDAIFTNCPFCDTKLVPLCPKCRPTASSKTDWREPRGCKP